MVGAVEPAFLRNHGLILSREIMTTSTSNRRICYVQYTNPAGYPPLEHSARILADRGWEVLFLGIGASGAADSFQFAEHPRIRTERWSYSGPGWRQKAHYAGFCLWTVWRAWRCNARWIYASDPLACPAAWLASCMPGRRVIYHEHDSPSVNDASPFFRRILGARRRLCQRAAAVVLPNAERARVFTELVRLACPAFTVWNCPERCEVVESPAASDSEFTLHYHGNVGPELLPLTLLKALLLCPLAVRLQFAGYTTSGNPGYPAHFLGEARRLGLSERVKFVGAMSRHKLLPVCATASLGIAFMPTTSRNLNMRAMTGASNKPFDYLACGLNLLVSDLPDWRAMFVEPGYARACDPADAASIAAAIRWWLEHPAEAETARKLGRQRILDEWNYERQFAPVLAAMQADEITIRS